MEFCQVQTRFRKIGQSFGWFGTDLNILVQLLPDPPAGPPPTPPVPVPQPKHQVDKTSHASRETGTQERPSSTRDYLLYLVCRMNISTHEGATL